MESECARVFERRCDEVEDGWVALAGRDFCYFLWIISRVGFIRKISVVGGFIEGNYC